MKRVQAGKIFAPWDLDAQIKHAEHILCTRFSNQRAKYLWLRNQM